MDILFIILGLLILLDIAAYFWGADSRDSWNSPEWERRHDWKGFGGQGN
jgi:hypothetical protein